MKGKGNLFHKGIYNTKLFSQVIQKYYSEMEKKKYYSTWKYSNCILFGCGNHHQNFHSK